MRRIAAALVILVAGCGGPPVVDALRIEFSPHRDDVVVTAETSFDMKPRNAQMQRRADAARAAALAQSDPWSIRFARVRASSDGYAIHRDHGVLERVTRSATIPPDDLQLLLSDVNITVDVLRGDGWRELTFYPGSSTRASREQQRGFDGQLATWSQSISRYLRALDDVYRYLDRHPQRAKWVFAAIISERDEHNADPVVLEDEQPLVDAVTAAMTEIAEKMDAAENRAATFAEEADLIFNPFPARVTVVVPGDILAMDGFTPVKKRDREAVIEPVDLFAILASFEGRWASPDPLALLLREDAPTAAGLAAMDRRSQRVVSSTEIEQEIRAQLVRPRQYVIRWRE